MQTFVLSEDRCGQAANDSVEDVGRTVVCNGGKELGSGMEATHFVVD